MSKSVFCAPPEPGVLWKRGHAWRHARVCQVLAFVPADKRTAVYRDLFRQKQRLVQEFTARIGYPVRACAPLVVRLRAGATLTRLAADHIHFVEAVQRLEPNERRPH